MKKIVHLFKVLVVYLLLTLDNFAANPNYLLEGKNLFNKKEFEKSKIFFERDLVFNPKSEESYLYLAKIFKVNENDDEEEINLNNVLLINPKNDEAIYMLILLKIKQSDYTGAKELIKNFNYVCKDFCSKKKEINEKFDKLIPENEKSKN